MFSSVRDQIRTLVVEHYSEVDGNQALHLYEPLLDKLCPTSSVLSIFTTNYDWTFESIDGQPDSPFNLTDGFRIDSLGAVWSRNGFDSLAYGQHSRSLVLFKLHGSTLWYESPEGSGAIRKFNSPATALAGSTAALVYPTQVKAEQVTKEPFATAYRYLRECLNKARLCIVIGFSFRDPAINEIFRAALAQNDALRVAIVDPSMNDSSGLSRDVVLSDLNLNDDTWSRQVRFIKGAFGDAQGGVYDELAATVEHLGEWDSLEPEVNVRRRR